MSARRLIGFVLTLFTFHLVLVGPDNVCTKHAHSSPQPPVAIMAHVFSDAGMVHDESGVPCDTPSSAHCCDAFASCAVAVALDSRDQLIAMPALALVVPASVDEPLLSRALGPEPPPPKL